MKWIMLLIASACEVTWAVAMNYSDGLTKIGPTVITGIFYIASALFLSAAMKELPLGTSYAIWTGIGIVGTTLLGVFLFNETLNLPQIICIIMIAAGIIGLKLLAN